MAREFGLGLPYARHEGTSLPGRALS
jgi:hypothetical protein